MMKKMSVRHLVLVLWIAGAAVCTTTAKKHRRKRRKLESRADAENGVKDQTSGRIRSGRGSFPEIGALDRKNYLIRRRAEVISGKQVHEAQEARRKQKQREQQQQQHGDHGEHGHNSGQHPFVTAGDVAEQQVNRAKAGSTRKNRHRHNNARSSNSEAASASFTATAAVVQTSTPNELPGTSRVFVTYKNYQGKEDALQAADAVHQEFDDREVVVVEVGRASANTLLHDENIASIEPDSIWEAQGYVERRLTQEQVRRYLKRNDDQGEILPYGVVQTQGHMVLAGPHQAKVCIVDTGAATNHPDLGNARMSGMNRGGLSWGQDYRGHGTHVAGTMAATCHNGLGVCGMGNGTTEIFVTRGLDDQGRAYESDVIEAINQCVAGGARVLSLSLGGATMSNEMNNLFNNLYDNYGILIFAASGNNGAFQKLYPAAHPKVIAVGGVSQNMNPWWGSNWGGWLELSAAGYKVMSTVSEGGTLGYALYSGTSMATPHCAAAAGLLWSHHPMCTNTQIRYALAYTARNTNSHPSERCNVYQGYGICQVKDALDFLDANDCTQASWGRHVTQSGECNSIDTEPY